MTQDELRRAMDREHTRLTDRVRHLEAHLEGARDERDALRQDLADARAAIVQLEADAAGRRAAELVLKVRTRRLKRTTEMLMASVKRCANRGLVLDQLRMELAGERARRERAEVDLADYRADAPRARDLPPTIHLDARPDGLVPPSPPPLQVIYDEAADITPEVWEAIDRMTPTHLVFASTRSHRIPVQEQARPVEHTHAACDYPCCQLCGR